MKLFILDKKNNSIIYFNFKNREKSTIRIFDVLFFFSYNLHFGLNANLRKKE